MRSVELEDEEWQKLMAHVANTMPWAQANPLLMKITQQLQGKQEASAPIPMKEKRS